MKTYFNRIRTLNSKFQPAHRGWSSAEEIELIKEILELDSMNTELELRNMRDMVVMLYDLKEKNVPEDDYKTQFELMDKMSAIVGVIDRELWKRGYEV